MIPGAASQQPFVCQGTDTSPGRGDKSARPLLPSLSHPSSLPRPFQSILPDVRYDDQGFVVPPSLGPGHTKFVDLVPASTLQPPPQVDAREVAWHRRKFPQAVPAKREDVNAVKHWVHAELQALQRHAAKGELHLPQQPQAGSPPKVAPGSTLTKGPANPSAAGNAVTLRGHSMFSGAAPAVPGGALQLAGSVEPVVEDIQVVMPLGSDGSLNLSMIELQDQLLAQAAGDLCRQVSVQCHGRGRLMEHLWEQMRALLAATIKDASQTRSMCKAATESEATKCNSLNDYIAQLRDKVAFLEQGMSTLNRKVVQRNLDVDQCEKKYKELETRLQQEKHTAVQEATHILQDRLTTLEENHTQTLAQLSECQVQNKQLKTTLLNVQNRLVATENELAQAKEQLGIMTPRPQRNLGILTDLLTPSESNAVQRLLVAGCSPDEVHRLLLGVTANDSDVSRLFHLLGCCKEHVVYKQNGRRKVPLSKENMCTLLMDLITKGDVKSLATYLPDDVLDGVSQAVNNGVDPESLVHMLYGTISPNGFDVTAYAELGGVLARKYGHTKEEIGGPVTDTLRLAQMRTAEKMQQLEEKVKGLGREVQKLKRTIADAKKDKKPAKKGNDAKNKPLVSKVQQFIQAAWDQFFVGLGTSDDVPKVLQTTSNVTNWRIPKPEAEAQANEIWEGKEDYEQDAACKITLQEYMYVHYSDKFKNNQKAIIENAYNLLYALSQHMYDADCNLFIRIFCEEVDEGIREDQNKIGDAIIDMLSEVDANINNTVTGWLSKDQVKTALAEHFKTKKPERLAEIFDALDTDESGDVVNYAKLFEEDEDMNQGMFAEVCRTQVLTDRLEQLQEVQDVLYEVCNTLNITLVEPSLLKDILKKVNPYATQEEVNEYLQRAFGTELKKAKPVSCADAILFIRRGFNKLPEPKRPRIKEKSVQAPSVLHALSVLRQSFRSTEAEADSRVRSGRGTRESHTGSTGGGRLKPESSHGEVHA